MAGKDYSSVSVSKTPSQNSSTISKSGGSSGVSSQDKIVRIAQGIEPKPVTPTPMSALEKAFDAYSKFSPMGILFNSGLFDKFSDSSVALQNKAIAFDFAPANAACPEAKVLVKVSFALDKVVFAIPEA